MFIRRTITNSRKTSQAYYTYRLVEGVRTGSVVKQTTLLNLDSHFDLPQADWPALAARIDALLHGQEALQLEPLSAAVEAMAQRCAAQLIALQSMAEPGASSATTAESNDACRFQEVISIRLKWCVRAVSASNMRPCLPCGSAAVRLRRQAD